MFFKLFKMWKASDNTCKEIFCFLNLSDTIEYLVYFLDACSKCDIHMYCTCTCNKEYIYISKTLKIYTYMLFNLTLNFIGPSLFEYSIESRCSTFLYVHK